MKKIITALTLVLVFSINANAQDKKTPSSAEKGKKEATELTKYLELNETQNADFERLFEQKHRTLEESDLSPERKVELARVIEAKIRASLDAKQTEQLEKNSVLFKKLIN